MISIIVPIKNFMDKMGKDRVGVYVAQASFFMILSIFPLIMLMLSILRYSGLPEHVIEQFQNFLPDIIRPLVESIIAELYAKTTGTILSMTAIAAVWSASKGVLSIMRGLNEIFDINENKNYIYLRFLSVFYFVLFLAAFAVSLVLLVFGKWLYHLVLRYIPFLSDVVGFFINNRVLLSSVILTVLFTFMYRMVRSPEYRLRNCIPGAIFSSVGWLVFSFLFSYYAASTTKYSYMYGSLTGIVLFMLWMYFCLYIFFLGAELNVIIKKPKLFTESH